MIENAYYILTPSAKVSEEKINAYRNFVSSLKALPIVLELQAARLHNRNDQPSASHHCFYTCKLRPGYRYERRTDESACRRRFQRHYEDRILVPGYVAANSSLKNGKNISHILGQYIEALIQAKLSIDTEDENALYTLFESSRDYRNSMPNTSAGPIKKQFAVYCDIIDETGGIATIATILASNNISIKNIGIIHNREFEEGVLRIEFYDESSSSKASALLKKYRYIVYEV